VSRFGGWNRVDRERVRETVLEADLSPLISADPRGAAKLIEAAVWDDNPGEGPPWDLEDPGPSITEAPHWHVAVPERGPFLRLLIEDPEVGLACVVSITERATRRWAEIQYAYTGDQAEYAGNPNEFCVLIDGQRRQLVGDAELLAWHRGTGRGPTVLACALMATESYLYKQLDEGKNITLLLKRLVASDSAAIWGVLTEVARYRSELMWGQLQPLISSPGLLMADKSATLGQDHLLLPFYGFIDKVHAERAQKWTEMPHRKLPLTELLIRDAFQDPDVAEKLAGAREIWAAEDGERWKHLIAQLDPVNRKLQRYEDDSFILDYEPPAELRGEIKEANTEIASSQIWLSLPGKLRKWIDERSEPSPEELESFWDESQKAITQPADQHLLSQGVIAKADLECGVAALFVTCAREWLRSHPERENWCRRALLAPFEGEPPATHEFDSAEQFSSDSWDGFCADALPLLWAESPQDPELRSGVARLAIHLHLETVKRTFRTIAGNPNLAQGLAELEHLSLHWARFKLWRRARGHAIKYEGSENAELFDKLPDFEPTTRDALNTFVAGTLGPPPRLRDWLAETPDGVMIARQARRQPVLYSLSLGHLVAARVHLATAEGITDELQRAEFAADLANSLVGELVPEGVDRIEGTPYTEEHQALDLLARLTLDLSDDDAEATWKPILEAGEPARYWVEAFLGELWSAGLLEERLNTKLVSVVKRILDFTEKNWTGTGRGGDGLALKVAGVDTVHHSLWSEQRQSVLTALEPQWSEWVKPRLTGTWFARYFARFLEAPAAAAVRAEALGWLADAERNREHIDSDLDEATAELLVRVYAQEAELISGAGVPAEAARYLLSRLAGRGIPLALELSARLG
jgi:hypothetical protein